VERGCAAVTLFAGVLPMPHDHVLLNNPLPVNDGDFSEYISDEAFNTSSPPVDARRIIWVNGTQNSPEDHRDAGLRLSTIIEGIYNQDGTLGNKTLNEYINDIRNAPFLQETLPGAATANAAANTVVNTWNSIAPQGAPVDSPPPPPTVGQALANALQKLIINQSIQGDIIQNPLDWIRTLTTILVNPSGKPLYKPISDYFGSHSSLLRKLVHLYFWDNVATVELFEFLMDNRWPMTTLFIVCHSQGNFIVSCALSAVQLANKGMLPRPVVVFALASPAPWWPYGLGNFTLLTYSNVQDIVPYLSLGQSFPQPQAVMVATRPANMAMVKNNVVN
jgi:hypothetical protein